MDIELQIIRGPSVRKVAKAEDAETQLRSHPQFPKNATVLIEEQDGRWLAAVAHEKVAAPPFGEDQPSSDSADVDEAPEPPKSEGPADDSDGEDKPKSDKPKDDKPKGEGAELAQVLDMLTKITDALGLSTGPDDSPVPGMDDPMGPPPGPDGLPGPGGPPDGGMGDGKTHTVHERALKPGEAPPGTTPVGAPSFASISANHPWAEEVRSGAKFWDVEDDMGNDSIATIASELDTLAKSAGCHVEQIRPNGRRVTARIVRD